MARWSDLEIETKKEQTCQNCHPTTGAKNEGWRGLLRDTHGSTIPGPFPAPSPCRVVGGKRSHNIQI